MIVNKNSYEKNKYTRNITYMLVIKPTANVVHILELPLMSTKKGNSST